MPRPKRYREGHRRTVFGKVLIVKERVVLTKDKLDEIQGLYGNDIYYYVPEEFSSISRKHMENALERSKDIFHEISKTDKLTKPVYRAAELVIEDVVNALETDDEIRKAIYEAYVNMCDVLQKYGFWREKSQTVREFRDAVGQAMNFIDKDHLRSLTTLFEEARYSDHVLKNISRKKAIRDLKMIITSIEKQIEAEREQNSENEKKSNKFPWFKK